ncbi:MAG: hypothetical protein RLZZ416_123 [Candidatus Parcubacteria bacterium]|jgi:hypothetical protein
MIPLRLWVDEKWRRKYTHIPLLFPLWGIVTSEKAPFQKRLFERYRFDQSLYALAGSTEDADVFLLPYRFNVLREKDPDLVREVARAAYDAKKPVLIDGTGDIEYPTDIPHAITLRSGGYRFLRESNDIQQPLYADDLLETLCAGNLQIRRKSAKARVGFAGWATLEPLATAKTILKELPDRLHSVFDSRYRACKKGIFFRREALAVLRRSSLVEPNFIQRASYSAHTATASDDPAILQEAFVQNLLESDYGLDVRGDANASARLFEILSLGRIPVIVDTERNFPFDDELDYSRFSLIVDFRDIKQLPRRIAAFHDSLSNEKFEAMQRAARDAYRNYFRVDAMTKHVVKRIFDRMHDVRFS